MNHSSIYLSVYKLYLYLLNKINFLQLGVGLIHAHRYATFKKDIE